MRNGRKINVVVFDWSGTLSDDRCPVWTANMTILSRFGKPTMTMQEWLPRTTVTAAEFFRNHGIEEDPSQLARWYKDELAAAKAKGIVPTVYPDAKGLLEYLISNSVEIGILSSHPRQHLLDEARQYGFSWWNWGEVVSDTSDKIAGLDHLRESFGVSDPRSMMYVDDTVFGTQAAKATGIVSCAVCSGYHSRERLEQEKPDFIFENLTEMRERWNEIDNP